MCYGQNGTCGCGSTSTNINYVPYISTSGTSTGANYYYNFIYYPKKYLTFKLPQAKLPMEIFVGGELISVGILGSNAQSFYLGQNKLVFSNYTMMSILANKESKTLSLKYKDCLYNYQLFVDSSNNSLAADKKIIYTKLISKVNF